MFSFLFLLVSVLTPQSRVSASCVETVWGHRVAEAEGVSSGLAHMWGRRAGVKPPARQGAGSSPVWHPAAPRPCGARRKTACRAQLLARGLVLLSLDVVFHCVHPKKGTRGSEALERTGVGCSRFRLGQNRAGFAGESRPSRSLLPEGDRRGCCELAFQEGGGTGSSRPPGLWPQRTEDKGH